MTPKRRAAKNLSWIFYVPLLQRNSTDQIERSLINVEEN